ncbi:MAG: ATP-binding protein, partial [Promethearchaeia archaeon]
EIEKKIPKEFRGTQEEMENEINKEIQEIKNKSSSLEAELNTERSKYAKQAGKFLNVEKCTEEKDIIKGLEYLKNKISTQIRRKKMLLQKYTSNFGKNDNIGEFEGILDGQQKRIGELEKEIEQCQEQINKIEEHYRKKKYVKDIQIANNNLTEQHQEALLEKRTLEKAIEILEEGQEGIREKVLPKTEQNLTKILPILTVDRYKDAKITEDYQIKVFDSKLGDYVEKTLFSGGTNDQIALAIRLSFAMVTMPENDYDESFIFLDEPLGFFDDERKVALIDFLTHGVIADKFSQRIVVSNFLDIKKYFDFVVELENGKIIEQYSTNTLESVHIGSEDEVPEVNDYLEIKNIEMFEEDNYFMVESAILNNSDKEIKEIEIETPKLNIELTPKNFYDVKPKSQERMEIGFHRIILEKSKVFFNFRMIINDNGQEKYVNQRIHYNPKLQKKV